MQVILKSFVFSSILAATILLVPPPWVYANELTVKNVPASEFYLTGYQPWVSANELTVANGLTVADELTVDHGQVYQGDTLVSNPQQHVRVYQLHEISAITTKAMREVAAARGYIHEGKTQNALAAANRAASLLQIAESLNPIAQMKDELWIVKKHLEYETPQQVLPEITPMVNSGESVSEFQNKTPFREALEKAREALQRNNKKEALHHLTLADKSLLFEGLTIPLGASSDSVQQAIGLLKQNKPQAADEKLQNAETEIGFIPVINDMPAGAAANDLKQAIAEAGQKNYEAAQLSMTRAEQWLKQSVQAGDQKSKEVGAALAKEINLAKTSVNKGLDSWQEEMNDTWQRMDALADYQKASLTLSWKKLTPEQKAAKERLIKARLDLAMAQTYHDRARVTQLLRASQAELKKATLNVPDSRKQHIQSLDKSIQLLEQQMPENASIVPHSNQPEFNKTLDGLDQLIQQQL